MIRKNNLGISLITLVITIVVIVILVGAIVLSISNNNPIGQATMAVLRNDITLLKEQYAVAYASKLALHNGNSDLITNEEISNEVLVPDKYKKLIEVKKDGLHLSGEAEENFDKEQIDIAKELGVLPFNQVIDGIIIPDGFYYVSGTKDTGIVISDIKNDDLNNSLSGNQYVWIPVESETDFERKYWNIGDKLTDTVEPYESGYSKEVQEYNEMRTKVLENHGFYIARYEASKSETGIAESKKMRMPWNNITWNNNDAMDSELVSGTAAYEGRAASGKLGYTSTQSTLIYGAQWDSTMKFIENSGTNVRDGVNWGNYYNVSFEYKALDGTTVTKENKSPGILIPTGSTDVTLKQNIYDLGGNVWEWTMEANQTTKRSYRGGAYGSTNFNAPPAYRASIKQKSVYDSIGFRVALYIK